MRFFTDGFSFASHKQAAPFSALFNLGMLFGPILLAAGLAIGGHRLLAGGEQAVGRVVEVVHDGAGREAPIVEFEVDGAHYYFDDDFVSAEFEIGETIDVRYDPADPNDARAVTFTGTWMLPVSLVAVGALATGAVVLTRPPRAATTPSTAARSNRGRAT